MFALPPHLVKLNVENFQLHLDCHWECVSFLDSFEGILF